jgi:hypothetical protein
MSKLRPILFNTEMVQAILEDRKRQTRRVAKLNGCKSFDVPSDWDKEAIDHWTGGKCPFGKIGNVLWVRETWNKSDSKYYFKASPETLPEYILNNHWGVDDCIWKPSIHMPFEACRLFLEITNIRVERLHEISENDAIKEGLISLDYKGHPSYTHNKDKHPNGFGSATGCFSHLWQSVYGAESWNANPWVWVIEFKQIPKPIALLAPIGENPPIDSSTHDQSHETTEGV